MGGMLSGKIHGQKRTDRFVRDAYACFSNTTHVPAEMPTSEIARRSKVTCDVRRLPGPIPLYRVAVNRREDARFCFAHPVIMSRKGRRL
jgi:hypothetical protein